MAIEALLVSQFVAIAAMLLLAGWLLWLNFRSPVNRSFALFLVLRAFVTLANRLKAFAENAGNDQGVVLWESMREYAVLALAPVLIYFWVVYSGKTRRATWLASLVTVTAIMEGAYLLNHCADLCPTTSDASQIGILALVGLPGYLLITGVIGLLLLRDALQDMASPRNLAGFFVAVPLVLSPILETSISAGVFAVLGPKLVLSFTEPRSLSYAYHAIIFSSLIPALAGLGLIARAAIKNPLLVRKARAVVGVAVLMGGSGLFIAASAKFGTTSLLGLFVLGLWRILLPAMVAFALVRHRLFGVDIRIRWAVVRSVTAFTFLGVFFVVAQLAQNYLSEKYGWLFGGLSAGLLLFAVNPIQKSAEGLTETILPGAKSSKALRNTERVQLFRDQAILVWSDGVMGRKERALLDRLRDQLGISHEIAARLEAEAAQQTASPVIAEPQRKHGSPNPK